MTDKLELNMNAYLPLRDVVFHTLREAILKGELKPGERLMELQLASKLGVSRTPIREAIRMLELEGLAVTVPRKGAEVAKMTEKDMEDVLQIRKALDELAVGLACDNMTEEGLEQLYIVLRNFEESTRTGNVKKIAQADVEFHELLRSLPEDSRMIFLLYYGEQFTTREIGQMLNMKEATVKSRLHRGKKKLRVEIQAV